MLVLLRIGCSSGILPGSLPIVINALYSNYILNSSLYIKQLRLQVMHIKQDNTFGWTCRQLSQQGRLAANLILPSFSTGAEIAFRQPFALLIPQPKGKFRQNERFDPVAPLPPFDAQTSCRQNHIYELHNPIQNHKPNCR